MTFVGVSNLGRVVWKLRTLRTKLVGDGRENARTAEGRDSRRAAIVSEGVVMDKADDSEFVVESD